MPVHSWSEYSFTKRVGYEEAIKKKKKLSTRKCEQVTENNVLANRELLFVFCHYIFISHYLLFRIFKSCLFLIMESFLFTLLFRQNLLEGVTKDKAWKCPEKKTGWWLSLLGLILLCFFCCFLLKAESSCDERRKK